MKPLVLSLLVVVTLSGAASRTFTGIITDDMCATPGGHSQMRMGPTDAECVEACGASHAAAYVLYDGKNAYALSDQQTPKKFAAQKVRVNGTLDAETKTIKVDSITAAN